MVAIIINKAEIIVFRYYLALLSADRRDGKAFREVLCLQDNNRSAQKETFWNKKIRDFGVKSIQPFNHLTWPFRLFYLS